MENRQSWIAGLAALGIVLHLALRSLGAPRPAVEAPLYLAVGLGGLPLLADIVRKAAARELGADLLAAISIAASVWMGEWLVAAILVLMLAGGGALERFATRRASSALAALARRMPQSAHRRVDGSLEEVPIDAIRPGELVVILPHELCPVDGTVEEGRGAMDESYLTGEPYAISKAPGSPVLSGAINGQSALSIRATRPARDSRYASIMRVMRDSESQRPRLRRLGDQLAAAYIPLALAAAAGAWWASGEPSRFLAVLVVATPCPLLIAIPVAVIGAISLAAARGIVVKRPAGLERIPRCRTIILDKTGTITLGKPTLTEIVPAGGMDVGNCLRLAAALERYSRHPLATAIVAEASRRGLSLPDAAEVSERPGDGLRGVVDGVRVRIGGRSLAEDAPLPPAAPGLECVASIDGRWAALFRFRDAPRADSRRFLRHLGPLHRVARVLMLSGDRENEVRYLAGQVGIADFMAEQTPEQKVAIVRRETRRAQTLFVGDGINDAPALAAATVGVAMGQNSDVTSAAASAVIMTPSIAKLDELIHIAARMRTIALESAIGGMGLSLIGMTFAAMGHLSPVQGAVAQELIDLAAVLNAVRVSMLPGRLKDF